MTAIDAIVAASTATVPASTSSTATTSPTQKMDSQMFLQLLVAQLRAQDPSSPMSTNDMMAQTSQLASMEQLTSLTSVNQESFSLQMRMAASGLIGKQIAYTDSSGAAQTGVASAVSYVDSVPMVTVGSASVRLDAISGVASVPAAS